jgi:predicted RNA-binding Zn ribbon-like protein
MIRDFVNTKDLDHGDEEIGTPEALAGWLASHGLTDTKPAATRADVRRAAQLREGLRALMLANNGVDVDAAEASALLQLTAARGRVSLIFADGSSAVDAGATGVDQGLGRIALAVHASMDDGSWPRLKACRAHDCQWAFIDTAKNHSRAWCSMRVCGNREKARAFRERAKQR